MWFRKLESQSLKDTQLFSTDKSIKYHEKEIQNIRSNISKSLRTILIKWGKGKK